MDMYIDMALKYWFFVIKITNILTLYKLKELTFKKNTYSFFKKGEIVLFTGKYLVNQGKVFPKSLLF